VLTVHRILTRPPRRTYASAVARNRPGDPSELNPSRRFESWSFTSRGLTLPVWDIPADNPAGPIAILSHGWGDSRLGALQRLPLIVASASRIIAWDMPGHGDAPGVCTLGAHEPVDLVNLLEHIQPDRPVMLYGWSMGAGISIAAAAALASSTDSLARVRIHAVVAEAPYRFPRTPAHNMLGAMRWPRHGLLGPALLVVSIRAPVLRRPGDFDRARLAGRVACPLLVLHANHDEICPRSDGEQIAIASPRAKAIFFGDSHHIDLWHDADRVREAAAAIASVGAANAH